jgi:hypothetical protein
MLKFFNLAAFVAAGTVVLLSLIALPANSLDLPMLTAMLILAAATGIAISPRTLLAGREFSETRTIASVGIGSALVAFLLISAALTFFIGAAGVARTYVWMAITFTVAGGVIGTLMTRGALTYIGEGSRNSAPSPSRAELMTELSSLRGHSPSKFDSVVERFHESLRYAANDTPGHVAAENAQLLELIRKDLSGPHSTVTDTKLDEVISRFDQLIAQREAKLQAARSKV